ncbi:MAG: SIS domain-containing protein [Chthoniobacterales bacterium]
MSNTTLSNSLKDALALFQTLSKHEESIKKAADLIEKVLLSGNTLFLCGNGGSAADAAHIATEFTCRFKEDRRPYPAMALGVDGGLLTAIGNDYDFQDIFSRQVQAFGRPGDLLIGISTSGKSRNVLNALAEARRKKMKTIVLLGKGGGFTTGAADLEITISEEETQTARIQEAQHFLLHVLCETLEERLPKE